VLAPDPEGAADYLAELKGAVDKLPSDKKR
jgi:hypothetical protein